MTGFTQQDVCHLMFDKNPYINQNYPKFIFVYGVIEPPNDVTLYNPDAGIVEFLSILSKTFNEIIGGIGLV